MKRNLRRVGPSLAVIAAVLGCGVVGAAERQATPAVKQSPVLLQADEMVYDNSKNIVTAKGSVEIASDDRVLLADSVTYDRNTGEVTADGHVSLLEPNGNVAFSDHVVLRDDLRTGALSGFSALFGENGRIVADTGTRRDGRYTESTNAVFTPCKICADSGDPNPLWQVKAKTVVHDEVEHELTFTDATFEFDGTPILTVPQFSTPDPSVKHRAGFLIPDAGTSTYLGSFARVPYYYSLSPTQDFTVAPVITSNAGTLVEGEYRLRWLGGGMWLQGSAGYDSNAATNHSGEWLSHLFGAGRFPLQADSWRLGFDVELASNDTYLRRYDISTKDRLVSDLFVDNVSGRDRFAATSYFFQSLRTGDKTGQIPLAFPLVEYTFIPEHKLLSGRLRVDANFLSVYRAKGEDMTRASLAADWRRPLTFDDGQVLTLQAFGRADGYHLQDVTLTMPASRKNTRNVGRALAAGVLEWRWPFASELAFKNTTLVVEPIGQLVYTPAGGNPAVLPNEDSTSFEFDETNLFSINKFPGLDRWSNGPRADAGIRATALLPTGKVVGELGQEYRLRSDSLFPSGSGLGDKNSDLVGVTEVQFDPYFDIIHRFRIDEQSGSIRRHEIYLKGKYGQSSVDLSYIRLSRETADPTLGAREEINAQATLGLYGNWAMFAGTRRNLELDKAINAKFGVIYEDDCFVASLGYERKFTRDRDLPPSTAILLHVGLKTGLTEVPF